MPIVTVTHQPEPSDAELAQLAAELQERSRVLIAWDRRRGGGHIDGSTVLVRLPDDADFRRTSDAEIAVIRSLELKEALVVCWPPRFHIGRNYDELHAPIREDIEAAAQVL